MTKRELGFGLKLANFFGALGYFFGALQWIVVALVYYPLLDHLPQPEEPKAEVTTYVAGVGVDPVVGTIFGIIVAVVVVVMVVISIFMFFKIPAATAKVTSRAVHRAAEGATPLLLKVQHKKDTKMNRKLLTPRVMAVLKLIFTLLPLSLVYFSQFTEKPGLEFSLAIIIGVWLAAFTATLFFVQYLLARFTKTDLEQLW